MRRFPFVGTPLLFVGIIADMPPWVRIGEYAHRYGVCRDTLRRWENEGVELPVRRSTAGQRVYDLGIAPDRYRYERTGAPAAPPCREVGAPQHQWERPRPAAI